MTAHPHYRYLDALRGLAILGVIAVHTGQYIPNFYGPLRSVTDYGRYGVHLFFVVSAIALLSSWHTRNDGAAAFYVRRLFRIAPMFWLATIAYLIGQGFEPRVWAPDGVPWFAPELTFLFLHGWHPETINAVVPGGWSIADEVMFYLAFPLLAAVVTNLSRATIAFVAATVVAITAARVVGPLLPETIAPYVRDAFLEYWFPTQIRVFLFGFVVFFAQRRIRRMHGQGLAAIKSRPLEYIGRVSYSAYFWHFAVLAAYDRIGAPHLWSPNVTFLVALPAIVAVTVAVSTVTYRWIEVPMIGVGSRLLTGTRPALA